MYAEWSLFYLSCPTNTPVSLVKRSSLRLPPSLTITSSFTNTGIILFSFRQCASELSMQNDKADTTRRIMYSSSTFHPSVVVASSIEACRDSGSTFRPTCFLITEELFNELVRSPFVLHNGFRYHLRRIDHRSVHQDTPTVYTFSKASFRGRYGAPTRTTSK